MQDRYRAFISYSHADAKWADWLHNALEKYRIPPAVAAQLADNIRNLKPVFKDQVDLGAAHDLTDSIRNALEHSDNLIVVCSPAAQSSRWVNLEIETYIQLHGIHSIYFMVVDGDIESVLPPAFLELDTMPLAVDPRSGADGKHDAIVRLVSGILDVPYRRLQQRDLRQRNQHLARITAASVVGMLITSSLAWYAFTSQREAELRREQAENLIEYMVGDLREKLEPIGRLSLLNDIGDQATKYYEALPADNLPDSERIRRARVMHQVGTVRFDGGDLDAASRAFAFSLAELTELHKHGPDNPQLMYELGHAHYWVGFTHWYNKDLNAAERHFQAYLRLSKSLATIDPDNIEWRTELGSAFNNLGALEVERQNYTSAFDSFQQSASVFQDLALATNDPKFHFEHSSSLSWLGSTVRNQGKLRESRAYFQQVVSILQQLIEQQDNAHWRYAYATGLRHLGRAELDAGNLNNASRALNEAAAEIKSLREIDPDNTHWQYGELMVHNLLVDTLRYADDLQQAIQLQQHCTNGINNLLDKDGRRVRWLALARKIDLSGIHLLLRSGDRADAKQRLAAGIANLDERESSSDLVPYQLLLAQEFTEGVEQQQLLKLITTSLEDARGMDWADVRILKTRALGQDANVEPSVIQAYVDRLIESGLQHPEIQMASILPGRQSQ